MGSLDVAAQNPSDWLCAIGGYDDPDATGAGYGAGADSTATDTTVVDSVAADSTAADSTVCPM